MNQINQFSIRWLGWIVAASWQLALLACIVGLACYLARNASPRLRYALWLLLLVKVFLPPGLATPWSVGSWGLEPMVARTGLAALETGQFLTVARPPMEDAENSEEPALEQLPETAADRLSPAALAFLAWAAGGLVFWAVVAGRYTKIEQITRAARLVDEGPLRVTLEQVALELTLRRVPDVLVTQSVTSPFLFGVVRPRIVLGEALVEKLDPAELRAVLAHELVHWQRRDTWVGWLQVAAQSGFWFHPFVWWANRQIRHERECVCDELVLRMRGITPEHYGRSILSVLTESRARSLTAGSLVGVFEPGAKLQSRMEGIMNFEPKKRSFDWRGRLYLAAIAILFVPMGFGAVGGDAVPVADAAEGASQGGPPQIVKTLPATGDVDVDPKLREITVTFDRDMGKGMSWTGGPPLMPPIDESRKAKWIDARTCVLPVKLEKEAFYRVGINSQSFKNFSDKSGVPALVSAIYFTTTGADDALKARARGPRIVKLTPANGAKNVDPAMAELVATFDMPMGDGMSWTGSGANFPKVGGDGKQAHWSADGLTCTLPVSLEPNHDYRLGLNSPSFRNFQSQWGVPLEAVIYEFRTRGKSQGK